MSATKNIARTMRALEAVLPAHASLIPSSEGIEAAMGSKHLQFAVGADGEIIPLCPKAKALLEAAGGCH